MQLHACAPGKYRVGVPFGGWWKEVLNSDAREYAGSGMGNVAEKWRNPRSSMDDRSRWN